ncbi:DUF3515 domain-containing protein [Geodermatophilus sp. DSM 44513]|uniref:DUF3515 domain-containing protein n=1 Tax=Geodermatophilus sp. DSM 44513 TaxID=1528104 RepID=UPI00127AE194|nr:DUF3515 domain-containing protein [Geodermatophilus sp. DSM 44513]WNV74511.1 DUF3515 domain-containing protein [Geodermatophilus sp. DSM 44513]
MALVVTAVVLPLVVVLLVLTRVLGGDDATDGPAGDAVADVDGAPVPGRADLPPLPVQVPPVTPEADAACPALMAELPLELAGEQSRPVQSDSPFAYAWGEPPVVLVCGVERPAALEPTSPLIQISGVNWLVDTTDPERIMWTAVDRPVYLQVTVSADTDSAPVTALGPVINDTLPLQPIDTGD